MQPSDLLGMVAQQWVENLQELLQLIPTTIQAHLAATDCQYQLLARLRVLGLGRLLPGAEGEEVPLRRIKLGCDPLARVGCPPWNLSIEMSMGSAVVVQ